MNATEKLAFSGLILPCFFFAAIIVLPKTAGAAADGTPLFPVTPPEETPFGFPDSPRESEPDYFTIAEQSQAHCAIVRTTGAGRSAAALLKTHLDLVTGAIIPLIDLPKSVPAGLVAIHVGSTPVGKQVELELPRLHYGDETVDNIGGYATKAPGCECDCFT
jgi:hypothetical protein